MAESINDFVAGVVGGVSGVVVGQPMDVVKVRMQTQQNGGDVYRSTFDCVRRMAAKEGVGSFFRGIMPPVLGVGALNATLFGTYGITSRIIHPEPGEMSLSQVYVCGAVAGLACCVVTTPTELVKCRTQVFMSPEQVASGGTSTLREAKHIFTNYGIRGLFKGNGITIVRDCPSFGAYFVIYEYFKRRLLTPEQRNLDTMDWGVFWNLNLAGGLAGVISWAAIYPIDVVKSQIQTQSYTSPQFRSSWECTRHYYKAQGASFFVRGITATLIRAFPMNAMTFAMYELTMLLLQRTMHDPEFVHHT